MIVNEIDEVEKKLNVRSFSESVERHMREKKFDSYLTTIVSLCNELDLEFKDVNKLMSPALKDKVELEAAEGGMLKVSNKTMMRFE